MDNTVKQSVAVGAASPVRRSGLLRGWTKRCSKGDAWKGVGASSAWVLAASVLLVPGVVRAATIVRTISDEAQLMQLFADANADGGVNVYQGNLAQRGYALTTTLNLTKGRVILKGGSSLSTAANFILNCQGGCTANGSTGRVIRVVGESPGVSLQLWGVTVTGGYSTEFNLRGGGGAWVENAGLSIQDSVIRQNKANQWGAGLLVGPSGSLYVSHSIIRDNENDQISSCGNGQTSFGGGVGVLSGGSAAIWTSSVTGNKACRGAGIATNGSDANPSSLHVYNSTVSSNTANFHGGGILLYGTMKQVWISFSTIAFNRGGVNSNGKDSTYGGGLAFRSFKATTSALAVPVRMWGTVLAQNSLDGSSTMGADCYADAGSALTGSTTGVASNFVGKNGNCGAFLNWTSATGGTTLIGTEMSPLDPLLNPTLTGMQSSPAAHIPQGSSPLNSEYTSGNRSRGLLAEACPTNDITHANRGVNGATPTHCDIGAFEGTTCSGTAFTSLVLAPGWSNYLDSAPPMVGRDCSGQVVFKNAIFATGDSRVAFTLPIAYRPTKWIYVPIMLSGGVKARLAIAPTSGQVSVEGGDWAKAKVLVSLDGASFALDANGFKPLALINGWSNAPYNTRNAAVSTSHGIVRLQGGMMTSGVDMNPFVLPEGARPGSRIYVNVDLCDAVGGRLQITPAGQVVVQPTNGATAAAQCFTSLEGVWFSLSATGYTAATLINSWTNSPYSTRDAAYSVEGGMVSLRGAIANSSGNNNGSIFYLPEGARPSKTTWLPVGLCSATAGRLQITPAGQVVVGTLSDFSAATCFTSLEGIRFAQ